MDISWTDRVSLSGVTDQPGATLVFIAVLIALGILLFSAIQGFRGKKLPDRWLPKVYRTQFDSADLSNPLAQMEAVSCCAFERVPLLNKEEARLLPLLERTVREARSGHRLMAQTSLGELIRPSEGVGTEEGRRRGYASVNSKRLDFALIDRFGYLIAAIEYQGSGHYHTRSFMRDAVKREALRKAGVETIEIPKAYRAEDVRSRLLEALADRTAQPD